MYECGVKKAINFNGKKLNLDLAFNTVIEYNQAMKRKDLDEVEKIEIGYAMIVKNRPLFRKHSIEEKIEIINNINEAIAHTTRKPVDDKKKLRSFDFIEDKDLFYSSFMQDYGIDLVQQEGKLHWVKFLWLFQGLGPETPIKRVMEIREKVPPAINKDNRKSVESLLLAKQYYRLDSITEEEREEVFVSNLRAFASKF